MSHAVSAVQWAMVSSPKLLGATIRNDVKVRYAMDEKLTVDKVQALIGNALVSFPHEECATCECFLGYLTQLQIDAGEVVGGLVSEYQLSQDKVHGCLGCDPCPPGDHFAQYVRERRTPPNPAQGV